MARARGAADSVARRPLRSNAADRIDRTDTRAAPRRAARVYLLAEYAALFLALPFVYRAWLRELPLLPSLWLFAAACLAALLVSREFDRRELWNADGLGRRLRRALIPFAAGAPLLVAATLIFEPERFLAFVRHRPWLWLAVMVLYPILSAYPQGLIYRTFVFHRYRAVFGSRWSRIAASAVAFAVVHVIFRNWLAPSLSLLGGLLFAWTYERTRSSLVTTLQHAAFGCLLFTRARLVLLLRRRSLKLARPCAFRVNRGSHDGAFRVESRTPAGGTRRAHVPGNGPDLPGRPIREATPWPT